MFGYQQTGQGLKAFRVQQVMNPGFESEPGLGVQGCMVVESVGLGFKASGVGLGVQKVPVALSSYKSPYFWRHGVARACQLEP